MKTTKIFTLLLVIVLVCGCKRDNWLDWKIENQLWLQENAKKAGVVTTPTGFQYKCIEAGWDKSARPDDVFDSSEGYTSYVSNFVSGFAEGLKKMHQFGEYEFYIPYELGYGMEGTGSEGSSSFIPPYSTLIFRVYLRSID